MIHMANLIMKRGDYSDFDIKKEKVFSILYTNFQEEYL